ncbi:G1 family glutamic endopeptidase [Jatrophihabitans sp.]|uniref:G1 family glutamic endopeptidase n=1 Tax=Jatrophihabitans sp. TaxID=1932789 RepID=UPI0030C69CFB|nr:hypothetical protein [Jatrophihabitans sp.]
MNRFSSTWGTRALTLGAAATLAVAGTLLAAGPSSAITAQTRLTPHFVGLRHSATGSKNATEQSLNWSGYIQSGSGYTASTATWRVPTLKTTYNGYSSTWVGIDGASSTDGYLIQTGTEADVVNKKASYDAWWEVITPTNEAPETLFSTLTIHAGDSITATVAKGTGGKWAMTLTDNTTGKTASHSSSFAGPGQSAEWIQEDTDVNGYISAAPDWQSVTFSGITTNGAAENLHSAAAVDIYDNHGTHEDSTGAPDSSGNGFTVTWLAPGTKTYVG